VCTLYSENVTSAWRSIAPVAALLREKLDSPAVWENFEYLAVLSEDFIKEYPGGLFPSSMRHMPADTRLVDRWKVRGGTPV
jgi:hypothetical protein